MQNVYDIAHELVRSLKETDQYKDYVESKAKLEQNPSLKSMMDDFQKMSIEFQTKSMLGEAPGEDMLQKVQSMSAIVMSDPTAAAYLQSQMQLSMIIQDIYKIIGEAIGIE